MSKICIVLILMILGGASGTKTDHQSRDTYTLIVKKIKAKPGAYFDRSEALRLGYCIKTFVTDNCQVTAFTCGETVLSPMEFGEDWTRVRIRIGDLSAHTHSVLSFYKSRKSAPATRKLTAGMYESHCEETIKLPPALRPLGTVVIHPEDFQENYARTIELEHFLLKVVKL